MSNNFPTLLNKLKMQFKITGVLIVALLANCVPVNAQTVAVAGFSFGGESAAVEKRFPISAAAIEKLRFQDVSGSVAMSRKVMALARAAKNSHLSLNTNKLANIKNSDQTLVVALVITN